MFAPHLKLIINGEKVSSAICHHHYYWHPLHLPRWCFSWPKTPLEDTNSRSPNVWHELAAMTNREAKLPQGPRSSDHNVTMAPPHMMQSWKNHNVQLAMVYTCKCNNQTYHVVCLHGLTLLHRYTALIRDDSRVGTTVCPLSGVFTVVGVPTADPVFLHFQSE